MTLVRPQYTIGEASHSGAVAILLLVLFCPLASSSPVEKNGFVVIAPLIPVNEIYSGGPARDGIPALDHPVFVQASEAAFLSPDDKLLGVDFNGAIKAYPIGILNYHELVNDQFNGQPVTVSYCPLCGTGLVFNPQVKGEHLAFGVSGLLYNNDLLMYDRNTDSLWSQIEGRAISGPLRGTRLERIPVEHTTWRVWSVILRHSFCPVRRGFIVTMGQVLTRRTKKPAELFSPFQIMTSAINRKKW